MIVCVTCFALIEKEGWVRCAKLMGSPFTQSSQHLVLEPVLSALCALRCSSAAWSFIDLAITIIANIDNIGLLYMACKTESRSVRRSAGGAGRVCRKLRNCHCRAIVSWLARKGECA